MIIISNVSEKVDAVVECKLDKKGVEDFQKGLKSYDIGKEFNYAVAIIEISIVDRDNEKEINNTVGINVAPKIQYIIPFVSEKLAKEYHDELLSFNKLIMFLEIGEDGKVILEDDDNGINKLTD